MYNSLKFYFVADNYSQMIRSINERERVEISTPGLETPQSGPSHSSAPPNIEVPLKITPTEFKKWVSGHPSPLNQKPFQIRTIEEFTMLQYLVEKAEEEMNSEENRVDETVKIQTRNFDYSSRFTELTPNSGVYIETSELEMYLMASRNCLQLARLLMKHFFSTTVLRKDLGLQERAITTIVDFVSQQGHKENWQGSSRKSIESALRVQLQWLKKNNE